jgi:hypothetical protein
LKKDPQAAEAFVAGLEAKLRALPLELGRPVRVWVQDEGRFGLHTIVRRCWGLRGVRVVKTHQKKYQWGYLYGALEIGTGRTEALFMPHAALEVSEAFLRHLALSEPEAEHVVIWDGAGFHQKSGTHALPDRVHVVQFRAIARNSIPSKSSGTCSKTVCATGSSIPWRSCGRPSAANSNRSINRLVSTNSSVTVPCLTAQTLPPISKY